jgi:hypothetical protein
MTQRGSSITGFLEHVKNAVLHHLWRLCVCDPKLMEACPDKEKFHYALAGLSILAFTILAALSGIYLSRLIFGATFFSMILGLGLAINIVVVYQLALVTISSNRLPHTAHFEFSRSSVGVRFFYLSFILLIVSTPLELYLFQNKIEKDLVFFKEKQEQIFFEKNLFFIDDRILEIEREIAEFKSTIATRDTVTFSPGDGPEQNLNDLLPYSDLSTEEKRLVSVEQELQRIQAQRIRYIEKFKKTNECSNHLIERIRILLLKHPESWGVTVILGLLFFFPFFFKLIKNNNHVYSLKCDNADYNMILSDYHQFKINYEKIFFKKYEVGVEFHEPYLDPPFNIKKKADAKSIKGKDELIEWIKTETR